MWPVEPGGEQACDTADLPGARSACAPRGGGGRFTGNTASTHSEAAPPTVNAHRL